MKGASKRHRRIRVVGILITVISIAGGAVSAYSGKGYFFSVLAGIVVGFATGTTYNLLAKTRPSWPILSFKDVLSWIFVW